MKKIGNILLIAFLLCVFIYVCYIDNIPNDIILFNDETLKIPKIFGITINNKNENSITTVSNVNENISKSEEMEVKLFNTLTIKKFNVSIIERNKVVVTGQIAGIKLYTNGVLIVGLSEIEGSDGMKYKPYENLNLQEGDAITKVNEVEITDTDKLLEEINKSNGEKINLTYYRNNEMYQTEIIPVKTNEGNYKLGLWVRDSAAGIGTVTYYEPSTGNFAALGHGIADIDTGELLNISNGELSKTKIISIVKGLKGSPGKIQGTIENEPTLGKIYKNTNLGIYGKIIDQSLLTNASKELEIAKKEEIELGEAYIFCSLDEEEVAKEYKINIEKIYLNNNYDNKSMLIKVTDEELINKTGGIIQGMSGCPVIQNGKFIGAVTNVLVNDPTEGYAVFGEIMLKESSEF